MLLTLGQFHRSDQVQDSCPGITEPVMAIASSLLAIRSLLERETTSGRGRRGMQMKAEDESEECDCHYPGNNLC